MAETKVTFPGEIEQNAMISWSPVLTNMTLGNGTVVAKYTQVGKIVFFKFIFTLGSTSAMGTNPTFSLPVTSTSDYSSFAQSLGIGNSWDVSASSQYPGACIWVSTTTARIYGVTPGTSPVSLSALTSASPMTWTVGDIASASGFYEVA